MVKWLSLLKRGTPPLEWSDYFWYGKYWSVNLYTDISKLGDIFTYYFKNFKLYCHNFYIAEVGQVFKKVTDLSHKKIGQRSVQQRQSEIQCPTVFRKVTRSVPALASSYLVLIATISLCSGIQLSRNFSNKFSTSWMWTEVDGIVKMEGNMIIFRCVMYWSVVEWELKNL